MTFDITKSHKTFAGFTHIAQHKSPTTNTNMTFSYFMPESQKPDKAIIWLSGLTCTEQNFITKAGAQKFLSEQNALIICPDTSPRGTNIPGQDDAYDFGSGAGFYVNATTDGYKDHYQMYDYIVHDIYEIVKGFGVKQVAISGHSMGGHGALIIGLREAELFSKVSAFSPIVHPTACPWGEKAFSGYLGTNKELWKTFDACELIKSGKKRNKILIEQGLSDEFFESQLLTSHFEEACKESGQQLQVNYQKGYDHSYYFISSFIDQHIKFLLEA
jgi:S-formylglutathione hydrolase